MNKIKINIEDLFNLTGAVIYNPDGFKPSSRVSTDTRSMKKNSIFIAIKGEKFDGHDYVQHAAEQNASAIIINKNRLKDFDNINKTIVTVKDTVKAYGELARIWRKKLNAKVIALTGSNGKTTTKEMLSKILEEKHSVCKTLGNNNNHIGVPLTIFSANEKNDFLVLELGTNHFGEINYTSHISIPDYALITNIGSSHLEFLKDFEGVANEKIQLFEETIKCGGKIFVNTDDKILVKKTKKVKDKLTFGFKNDPDIKGELLESKKLNETLLRINFKNKIFDVKLPVSGVTNAKNFLAAASVALGLGISQKDIKNAALKFSPVDKRLNVIDLNGTILINDTYNANPESMKSALEFLNTFPAGQKRIAVLGDMFELGSQSEKAHRNLVLDIKRNRINEVYTIGKMMNKIYDEILSKKILIKHFPKRELLAKALSELDFKYSVVLVKGSRGMRMEEFFNLLRNRMN